MGQIDDGLIAHITEQLAPWAKVGARRMFGGWGIYRSTLMFALVADDELYLKHGAALTEAAGSVELKPFVYEKPMPPKTKGGKSTTKKITMSYALVPPAIMEDSDEFCRWAEAAWRDALAGRRLAAASKPHSPFTRHKPKKPGRRS